MTTPQEGRANAAEQDPTVGPDDEVGTSHEHGVPTDEGDRSDEPDEHGAQLPAGSDDADEPQVGMGPTD
jgi:hypothetical protein